MRIEFDREAGEVTLGFDDREEVRSFFERAVSEGGVLVELSDQPAFRQEVTIQARSDDGVDFACRAEVSGVSKTAAGKYATALLLGGWGAAETERLKLALATASSPRRSTTAADADLEEEAGETRGTSPIHRIRAMNPNQRTILARKADRVERQILLKDSSPQVLQALLLNPRVEGKDVVRVVKSTHTTGALLKRIVEDGRWGKNQEVLGLVAKNPKTPSPVALRLIEKLRTSDLRFMAKISSGVRDNIRRAALREYMRRTGR